MKQYFALEQANPVYRICLPGRLAEGTMRAGIIDVLFMEERLANKIRLSGTVAGTKFKIGAGDRFLGFPSPKFETRHLQALRAFLTLFEIDQLHETILLREDVFAKHFPMDNGVHFLESVLGCWIKYTTKAHVLMSTFAGLSFYARDDWRIMRVNLNETTIDLIRKQVAKND